MSRSIGSNPPRLGFSKSNHRPLLNGTGGILAREKILVRGFLIARATKQSPFY